MGKETHTQELSREAIKGLRMRAVNYRLRSNFEMELDTGGVLRLCDAALRGIEAKAVVNEQAEDDGLWFIPVGASEAYLQQALRRLHEVIENKTSEECARSLLDLPKAPTGEREEVNDGSDKVLGASIRRVSNPPGFSGVHVPADPSVVARPDTKLRDIARRVSAYDPELDDIDELRKDAQEVLSQPSQDTPVGASQEPTDMETLLSTAEKIRTEHCPQDPNKGMDVEGLSDRVTQIAHQWGNKSRPERRDLLKAAQALKTLSKELKQCGGLTEWRRLMGVIREYEADYQRLTSENSKLKGEVEALREGLGEALTFVLNSSQPGACGTYARLAALQEGG